jgi:hypothetical protein
MCHVKELNIDILVSVEDTEPCPLNTLSTGNRKSLLLSFELMAHYTWVNTGLHIYSCSTLLHHIYTSPHLT